MTGKKLSSLWSQILGVGLHGPRKGQRLGMLPAVFVGYGTWQRMAPRTRVLDMEPVRP